MNKFLGIDTSNYTTSAAVFDLSNMSIKQAKLLLPVEKGEHGIRQSDAVFHHIKQLPMILSELIAETFILNGVGVSIKPRLVKNSYMPCFLVGEGTADSICTVLGLEADKTSHQMGHILAALYSCNKLDLLKSTSPFIAFHVSGGTTDVLYCLPNEENVLDINEIGGSSDLKAGQVIDRVGVRLGLDFPCGRELENLSKLSIKDYKIKSSIKELYCSLSGIENQCNNMILRNELREDIANFCLTSVLNAIYLLTKAVFEKYDDIPIIYAGGVMSNKTFQKKLSLEFNSYFAKPELSSDNAVGVAIYSAIRKGYI